MGYVRLRPFGTSARQVVRDVDRLLVIVGAEHAWGGLVADADGRRTIRSTQPINEGRGSR
jgi:hypothetical protein